jgi:hypothetical protein
MLKQLIALLIALFVALTAFVWTESYSSSFQDCINQSTNNPSNQSGQHKESAAVIIPLSYIRCTERFADRHNG